MSRTITITCDANGCCACREYSGIVPVHTYLRQVHWHEAGGFDYCPKCWPVVKKELEEMGEGPEDDND